MVVKRLTLENLGHLGNRSFDFWDSLNVIVGANCHVYSCGVEQRSL